MLGAMGCFVANDSCMKLAMSDAPPLQVLAMRGTAATLWCLPLVLVFRQGAHLPKLLDPWILLRSLGELFAILCFIFGLRAMPIADITAIYQIAPLIVLMAGAWIWGDRIGVARWVLIMIGIAGALLVAQPGSSVASPYAVLGFGTALGAACRDIFSRKVPGGTPALIVSLSTLTTVLGGALIGTLIFEDQVMPPPRVLMLMAIAGFILMCGHATVFMAYRLAPARVVAPFAYGVMVWAVLSGLLVFQDVPNLVAAAGMAVIAAAGLAVVLMEGRTRQGVPASRKPDSQVISS